MEQFKALITSHSFGSCGKEAFDILEAADIRYSLLHQREVFREEDLVKAVADFDALIVGADIVSRKVIESAPRLKIISKHGVGLDNIDLEAAKEKHIVVAAAAGSNNVAVAELTAGLILASARKIARCDREVKAGEWNRHRGTELAGATLGVIGTGRIGKEVIIRMKSFGMNILAFDTNPDMGFAEKNAFLYAELDELLKKSDFVCIHVPLTAATRHLLNRESLGKMKKTAVLVNTARGGIVDEEALYRALANGELAGAAIDTFENEPPGESGLLTLQNVIATPHIGAYTKEAIDKMSRYSAEAVAAYARGEYEKKRIIV